MLSVNPYLRTKLAVRVLPDTDGPCSLCGLKRPLTVRHSPGSSRYRPVGCITYIVFLQTLNHAQSINQPVARHSVQVIR